MHLYADDMQLCSFCYPSDCAALSHQLLATIDAVDIQMASNQLRLNAERMQFLWCGSKQKPAKCDLEQLAAIHHHSLVSTLSKILV